MTKKITTKIKIANYDLSNNTFLISFQLAPGVENDLALTAEYDAGGFGLSLDTENYLSLLGYCEGEKVDIFDELKAWAWRSRAKLGGQSYGDIMYTRITEVITAARLRGSAEKTHRGKAEAERIVMEAPVMDWAMSCLERLEAEAQIDGPDKPTEDLTKRRTPRIEPDVCYYLSPEQENEMRAGIMAAIKARAAAGKVATAGVDLQTGGYDEVAQVISKAAKALYRDMNAARGYIAAMEAVELGEKPLVDFNTLLDRFETSVRQERDYSPSISQWSDGYLEGAEALQSQSHSARRAILDQVEALTPKPSAPSSEAIDDAVDAIHSDLMRFLTKMSFREHDYVREFIREEIEKVVAGVL